MLCGKFSLTDPMISCVEAASCKDNMMLTIEGHLKLLLGQVVGLAPGGVTMHWAFKKVAPLTSRGGIRRGMCRCAQLICCSCD